MQTSVLLIKTIKSFLGMQEAENAAVLMSQATVLISQATFKLTTWLLVSPAQIWKCWEKFFSKPLWA